MHENPSKLIPKGKRIRSTLDYLHALPPARTALEAYMLFAKAINEVEDAFLGADSYDPPKTFLDGTTTERMYMTLFESVHPVPRYSGVHALIHVKEVIFISRYGAIEIQRKNEDDTRGFDQHFSERKDLIMFKKADASGHGVWHKKNK
jgi:hypothetical protein